MCAFVMRKSENSRPLDSWYLSTYIYNILHFIRIIGNAPIRKLSPAGRCQITKLVTCVHSKVALIVIVTDRPVYHIASTYQFLHPPTNKKKLTSIQADRAIVILNIIIWSRWGHLTSVRFSNCNTMRSSLSSYMSCLSLTEISSSFTISVYRKDERLAGIGSIHFCPLSFSLWFK